MLKFKVIRKSVRWNKQTYHAGEYLPESFTEKDMYRVLYPSRIQMEEVKEPVPSIVLEGTKKAASTPVAPVKTTGAAISGVQIKAIQK